MTIQIVTLMESSSSESKEAYDKVRRKENFREEAG